MSRGHRGLVLHLFRPIVWPYCPTFAACRRRLAAQARAQRWRPKDRTCRPIDHRRLRRWSLGRLLAKHGIPMNEDVTEMFTAQMTLCRTDAKSQVENVLRQLIVAVKLPE